MILARLHEKLAFSAGADLATNRATWCPPCRKEMPDLQALYDRYKDQGFVVL